MNHEAVISRFAPQRHSIFIWILILIGCAAGYGFSLGLWRSPLMGVSTALKFPLMLLLVLLGNAGINSMVSGLLGVPLGFFQSLQLLVNCFAVFCLILFSCVPVFMFFTFSLPSAGTGESKGFYEGMVLLHVFMIALAGCTSHLRLYDTVLKLCGSRIKAKQLMVCWLSVNLLLGAQLSWNLRPFFGHPGSPVQMFREDPFDRNFFEAVYTMASSRTKNLLNKDSNHD